MASYPEYSADFFDGQHYVIKGASPATARELVRRSFRNWFRPNYPFVYAKFRTARASAEPASAGRRTKLKLKLICEHMPTTARSLVAEFAADVARDLALVPKQLQSKYLYDALGSSLFEAICRLPWYRITRSETELLSRHAGSVVAALGDAEGTIVELGCGSGEKIVLLAEALERRGGQRARAPHRHFVAGARAERAAAEPAASRLRRRALVDVRGGVADGGRGAPRRQHDARAAPRLEHRKLRSARRGALSRSHPRDARPRRSAAARRRPRQAGTRSPARLRRSARRHGRVQQEPPRPHQPRARRGLRSRRRSTIRRSGIATSAASRCTSSAAPTRRCASRPRGRRCRSAAASGSGPRAPTNTSPTGIVEMGAEAGFAARDQWVDSQAGFALTLLGAM